ncbi:hypothetical protein [Acuticoccus sp.]|uniref:hypothetical protein n=1 Tax=Acuticoccus sp. TaxID=1904378 RepID=UPI003B52185C
MPKCAGTSLHELLKASFAPDDVCPHRHDVLPQQPLQAMRRWRYFGGHFSKYGIDAVPGPKRVVTVLREPRRRILSLYYFWRSHRPEMIERGNLAGPRHARALGLVDFLNCHAPEVVVSVRNYMVRAMLGPLRLDGAEGFRLNERQYAVETALANLSRFTYVAFDDTLGEDAQAMTAMLGLNGGAELGRLNTFETLTASDAFERIEREEPSGEALAALDRLTRLDRLFYERARTLRHTLRCPYPL